MANPDPSKTEQATPKKIEDARNDGDVLRSQDVGSIIVLFGTCLVLYHTSSFFSESFREVFQRSFTADPKKMWTISEIQEGIIFGFKIFLPSMILSIAAMTFLAFISQRVQVGSYFKTSAMKWKWNSLNPASGFKQLLPNKDNLVRFGLTIAKVTIVSIISWFVIKQDFQQIINLATIPYELGAKWMLEACIKLTFIILVLFIVVAIIDFIVKKKQYADKLMMTKQEVKDEHKNAEGDPKIKAKIRQKMREILSNSIKTSVEESTVVITNPIHVAVALTYKSGDPAPRVVAKGLRKRAQLIKKIAREAGVPIIEAPPLARSLYRDTENEQFIDNRFFKAVATILMKLKKQKKVNF